jgi:integrase/ribosomal protein L40E
MAIYDFENRIEKQKEMLALESPQNKDLVERFVRDQKVKSEISPSRVYILYSQMRFISRIMKDKLQNPNEEDIKDLVENINNHKVAKGKQKPKDATDVTKRNIKATARQFFRWLNDDTPPKYLKLIRTNNKLSRQMEKEIISPELHQRMIDACENARDKAILSLLYDSGVRAGELLNRKIKDLEFEDYGLVLRVRSGKTGYRQVVVVGESPIYLRQWLDVHPEKNNTGAPLFMKANRNGESGELDYNALRQIFQRIKERAGITERIHPHLYRHTRASILAGSVAEAPLESQMGWIHGSKMSATYVHLSAEAQKSAILKAYGLEKEDTVIQARKPIKCARCGTENLSDAVYCRQCWLPLTTKASLDLKEKEDHIQKELENRGMINPQVKAIIENMPESERTGILASIIELALKEKDKTGMGK